MQSGVFEGGLIQAGSMQQLPDVAKPVKTRSLLRLNSQQSTCTETGDSRDDSASSSCSTSNSPSFWSDSATKILINEVKQREVLTNKGKQTKKRMWEDISKVLAGNGFRFTWEQVQGRMKTLTTNLKKINDHNSKSGFMDLTEELIKGVLKFISVTELLMTVSKVNKKLHDIIERNCGVFVEVSFNEDCFVIDKQTLKLSTMSVEKLHTFEVGSQIFDMTKLEFNQIISRLAGGYHLKRLNLCESPLFDFSFLQNLVTLTSLDISNTQIIDDELKYLKNLSNLTELYLSFTALSVNSIVSILGYMPLKNLDACQVKFSFVKFRECFVKCPTLQYIHTSFISKEDESNAKSFIYMIQNFKDVKLAIF
ncbi:unnamed protein product [Mytilus edulis]|uniref:F-box domain-containing protein n=1 Tax=Mytilus edulis TaxID=6550 RepID=A0A8S3PWL4_MYTED|nr:unnamed protein product [Mytilus edulis]